MSNNDLPRVSVIIPTLNEEEFIEKCLKGLNYQTVKPFEVIVVDGGSTDNTVKIAKSLGAITFQYPDAGTGMSRNIGAYFSKGDILAFIDADVIPHPKWCENISYYFHEHPETIGAGGIKIMNTKNRFLRWIYFFLTSSAQKLFLLINFAWFSGTNVAYRRKWFFRLGGFKKTALSEDIMLSLKASRIGKMGHHGGIVFASDRRIKSEGFLSFALFYLINIIPTIKGKPIGYYPKIGELKKRKFTFLDHFKTKKKKEKKQNENNENKSIKIENEPFFLLEKIEETKTQQ